MFTVSLELPDLCDPGDWQDVLPTPLDAVNAFIASVSGSPDLWVYSVSDGVNTFLVDMANGPSITKVEE
jgi:hypothetical protein